MVGTDGSTAPRRATVSYEHVADLLDEAERIGLFSCLSNDVMNELTIRELEMLVTEDLERQ
jgi:hypothetical protein